MAQICGDVDVRPRGPGIAEEGIARPGAEGNFLDLLIGPACDAQATGGCRQEVSNFFR